MQSAQLLGRDHRDLGVVAAVAEGPAAIALCRGGAAKRYAYTDPNEDACCFALGPGGALAAIADGHDGARGAERIVRWVVSEVASAWTAAAGPARDRDGWCGAARAVVAGAHAQVLAQAEELSVRPAPSTFAVALVRPDEDRLVHASIGDSHVFVVSDRDGADARDVGWASTGGRRPSFAGEPFPSGTPDGGQLIVGCESLAGVAAIALATDGLSERGIGVADPAATADACVRRARGEAADVRALEACRGLTEAALEAHRANGRGDNIATAVLWVSRAVR